MEKSWSAKDMPRLDGKIALVTGANRGLGFYTSLELARAGAQVIMAVRDRVGGGAALREILAAVPAAKLTVEELDLASLGSVRAFGARAAGTYSHLDILLNNAAVMTIATRELTVDGFERQMGTNHLGHFALTGVLLDRKSVV